jgi:hypothetical protein
MIDRIIYFEEEHVCYLFVVEILILLKISYILAHGLCGTPEMWEKVLFEEFF